MTNLLKLKTKAELYLNSVLFAGLKLAGNDGWDNRKIVETDKMEGEVVYYTSVIASTLLLCAAYSVGFYFVDTILTPGFSINGRHTGWTVIYRDKYNLEMKFSPNSVAGVLTL